MPNKSTHWITLPDEALHTPADNAAKKEQGQEAVKHKWFWGIAFVVVMVVTFALLAPDQFNELLKGSLFDAPGAGNPIGSPTDLLSPDAGEEGDLEEETEEVVEEEEAEPQDETVVGAEEEAVSISVEPIEEAEPIEVEPTAEEGPADCDEDVECFIGHLADCSLAKVHYGYEMMGESFETDIELVGEEADHCLLEAVFTKSPLLINLDDKEARCKIEKGSYTESSLRAEFSDPDEALSKCSGSAIDELEQYSADLEEEPEEAPETTAESDLVAQLTQQLEALQTQRDLDLKTMQELADAATQVATDALKGAATPASTTPPTSVAATTALAQPTAIQPAFRPNTHTVSVTPEQMLAQNQATGFQIAQAPVAQPAYQQPLQTVVGPTPDTGPSEILLIAFMLAFLSLVGWKFVRTFA